jgi:outer membrane protein TolC
MLKGCNSCTTEKRYEYKINQYKIQVDSLQNSVEKHIIDYNDLRDSLSEQIHILESNNILLQDAVNNARKDIEYQRRVNTDLVDVTKNLSSNNEATNK